MTLSNERANELAMLVLVAKLEEEGLMLKPKEVKRQIANVSKKLGISVPEMAKFSILLYEKLYESTKLQLLKLADKVEE